jgi:tetratricopeptide (TPR) repeat protein
MKKTALICFALLINAFLCAQIRPRERDSIIKLINGMPLSDKKLEEMNNLSLQLMGDSMALSDYYGTQQIIMAEESRKPELIIRAYANNALRYRNIANAKDNADKAFDYARRGLAYAESMRNNDGMAQFYCIHASLYRSQLDNASALDYNNKAVALIPDLTDDSVKVLAYQSLGNTQLAREESVPAFKSYLNALQIAESSKRGTLIENCYNSLSGFYLKIKQYVRAREYAFRMLEMIKERKNPYDIVVNYEQLAGIYIAEKQYDLAKEYYEKIKVIADSMNSDGLKFRYRVNILNLYFSSQQLAKGAEYFNQNPQITQFIENLGMGYQIDLAKASVMNELGKTDSAAYYFKRTEQRMMGKGSPQVYYIFYLNYFRYFSKLNQHKQSLDMLQKAYAIAETSKDLEMMQDVTKEMDTVYAKMGNMQMSALNKSRYYQLKDSLASLSKEKELVNLQIEDENKRQERMEKEKKVKMERRHNIQLMGLSIGIFTFLCVLLMLGRFRVSETLIKIMSFIALIFLFEFIILIADRQIHEWTHGEPIKVILIKVVVAGILLPLHHVFEHKMISYLTTRNKLSLDSGKLLNRFKSKKITIDSPHS